METGKKGKLALFFVALVAFSFLPQVAFSKEGEKEGKDFLKEAGVYARKKVNESVGEKVLSSPNLPDITYSPSLEKKKQDKEEIISLFFKRREGEKPSEARLFILAIEGGSSSGKSGKVKEGEEKLKEEKVSFVQKVLTGECYFDRDLKVSSVPLPVVLKCAFGNRVGKLYGELTPRGYSLLLLPKKVEVDGKFFSVKGYCLNEATQDLNVASSVNKRILEKIFLFGTEKGLEGLQEGVKEYYENKDTQTYVQDRTVVQEKKISKSYPLVYGVVSFVQGAFSEFINLFKKEYGQVPVLWTVKAGTTVKAELEVEGK